MIEKKLSIKDDLNEIRPYLKDINSLKKSDSQKIHLILAINVMSSKDTDRQFLMLSKCNSKEIMISDKADEVIEEIFESLLSRYQINLETTMKEKVLSLIMPVHCITDVIKKNSIHSR